ncbi:transporter [Rhizobium rhizosphaerae]|uniref:Transporter n=1 Tax=Xaviernesmea rhizosphaerae TaxID=1672749 RepID=A0A1Q9AJA0_9HYPH|nr:transporter [Xaviernesmea rhizosphaerae]OLP55333.1 transporter [Xaviernesmea rhizosphaerae]OQP87968.1 transporter [Xaviernesmea rhizosphaerae]
MKYIPFILFTVLTNAAAQLMLKQGMISLGPLSFTAETAVARIFQILFNPWVFAGLVTFAISMASHLFVLSKVELSFAYPFLSLAYVAVAIFAYFVFREDLNAWRIAGIAFICVGTFFIAQSGRSSESHAPDAAVQGTATKTKDIRSAA